MRFSAVAVATLLASSAAGAQVSTIQSGNTGHYEAPPRGQKQDLNKITCEVTETTGTRLGARKVCKTAIEWQQFREEQRGTLEKVQQQNTDVPVSG